MRWCGRTKGARGRSLAAAGALALLLGAAPAAHAGDGSGPYSFESTHSVEQSDWMQRLPGNLSLAELSIPGTHDSGAIDESDGAAVQTQSMDIDEQLKAGIRAFDIRLSRWSQADNACYEGADVGRLWVTHGAFCQGQNFDSVLAQMTDFLADHDEEVLLVRIQHETNTLTSTLSDATFEDNVEDYLDRLGALLYQDQFDRYPTLAEAAGRIVVLQNWAGTLRGFNWSHVRKQDDYTIANNWQIADKWWKVEAHAGLTDSTRGEGAMHANFLSASGGSFPYFVASGKSSPGSNDPPLLTGWARGVIDTCSGANRCLRQYPNVNCFWGTCSVAFRGVNALMSNHLKSHRPAIERAGLVFADFPGADLIRSIIRVNYRDLPYDNVAPTAELANVAPQANAHGWHNSLVTLIWGWEDNDGGVGVDPRFFSCQVTTTSERHIYDEQGKYLSSELVEGRDVSLGATCPDYNGNEGKAEHTLNIDMTAPAAAPSASSEWSAQDATATWNWSDALSGPDPDACPATSKSSGEGAALAIAASCRDLAGNPASAQVTVKVDKTKPAISLADRPPGNSAGWHREPVRIQWTCTDALSGVVAATVEQTVATDGAARSATGTCTDRADNRQSDTQTGIRLDQVPPASAPTLPDPNPSGWYRSDTRVNWNWSDGLSGLAEQACAPGTTSSGEGERVKLSTVCTDLAGNAAGASRELRIDKTAPVIALESRPAANPRGWFRDDVTIVWSCSDLLSGADAARSQGTVSSEGAGQQATGVCRDRAGNEASAVETDINVDKTAPAITIGTPSEGSEFDFEEEVPAQYACPDKPGGSGTVSCTGNVPSAGALDTLSAGVHSFTVDAADGADNTATETVSYRVRKAPTVVSPRPLLLRVRSGSAEVTVGEVSAKLTYGPKAKPATGRRVVFRAGATELCTATANASGTASCFFPLTDVMSPLLSFGYTAVFAGDANLLPSSSAAPAADVFGWRLF